ncbi:MAG: hypothetical protein H6R21_3493 [Proteobacteria bacterium]|nr:hypothetical protein [Pseudomonadota bacterium]
MRLKFGKSRATDDGLEVTEERGMRVLHLGSRAIQSAMRVSRPWDLELAYTRAMMGFLMFNPMPQDVLMIGLGGAVPTSSCSTVSTPAIRSRRWLPRRFMRPAAACSNRAACWW